VTELFASRHLRTDLEQTFHAVVDHIAQIRPDEILSTPDEVIIEAMVREASFDCPQLQIDQVHQLPVVELSEYVGPDGDGNAITRQVPQWRSSSHSLEIDESSSPGQASTIPADQLH